MRIRKCEGAQAQTCAGCEARQQTIRILADMIDWHRQQHSMTTTSASMAAEPPAPRFQPTKRNHMLEEEEDVLAALENEAITTEEAERALAAIQAFNTEVEIQR